MLQPLIRPPVTLPDGPQQAAQGVSATTRALATDGLAALSSSVVNAALGERLAELSLSGQFPHTRMSSGLIDAVADLLHIQQQDGETLESYGERILAALKDLSPQEQLKLQARLDSLIKGLSLTLLRALLVDPQGPSATRLAFMLELQANGSMRDAASQITSTYQETALADDAPAALAREPAMQGPPRAPVPAQPAARPASFPMPAHAASNTSPGTVSAHSAGMGSAGDAAADMAAPEPINDDQTPAPLAPRDGIGPSRAQEVTAQPAARPGLSTATTATAEVLPHQEESFSEAPLDGSESHTHAAPEAGAPAAKRAQDMAPVRQPLQMALPEEAEANNGLATAPRQDTEHPVERSQDNRSTARQTAIKEQTPQADRAFKFDGFEPEIHLLRLNAQTALLDALEHVTSLQMPEEEHEELAEKQAISDDGTAAKANHEPEAEPQVLSADAALMPQKYAQNLHQQIVEDGSAFTGLAQALLQMPMAAREGIMPAYVLYPAVPDGAAETEDRVHPVEPEDEDRHRKGGHHSHDGQSGHQQEQQDHPADDADATLAGADDEAQTDSRAEDYYLRFADI